MRDKNWRRLGGLALLLIMTFNSKVAKVSGTSPQGVSGDERWVESTLQKMTLREKLGQLLMPYAYGAFMSQESPEYKELLHQVQDNKVGGFMLGAKIGALGVERGQAYPSAVLTNQLQRLSGIPLLISADFERGTAPRVDEGTVFPYAMAVAAAGQPRDAFVMGKITALEARAVGVNWVFAPVVDVNDNPDNPIINIRSFGEDPQSVSEFSTAFIRGVQENGALATAKHFPGHGDVTTDSHLVLPTVPGDRQRLESVELVPFRAAIAAGVNSIMTGHLAVPALEPDTSVPATLSPRILTGLLRKEMHFDGLIVADALEMGGITAAFSPAEAAVRAVSAGVDVLLLPPNPDATLAALEDAVASGRVSRERIDESVRRILRAKARLGLQRNRLVDLNALSTAFARPEFQQQSLDIASRGITLLRDTTHLLPLDATRPARILLTIISADSDPYPGESLEKEVRTQADSLTVLRADIGFVKVETLKVPAPETYDLAIVALFVRVSDRKGNVGLPENQLAFVLQLLAAGKPAVLACFGSPYLFAHFPVAPTWLASFSTNDVSQQALGRALFGETAVNGRLPVSIPGSAKRGDGLSIAANPMTLKAAPAERETQLRPAFDLLNRAVVDGAFPGGVLAVGYQDELLLHPFGKLTYDAHAAAVTVDTLYDVASLTKPVTTTTAIMLLVARGAIALDALVSRYLPEFANGAKLEWRTRVTVSQLLLHTSGLPAHRNYFLQVHSKREVLAQALTEPLVSEPGTHVEYSDLSFILLGEIIERVTGEGVDAFAQKEIFAPLAMNSSLFNPLSNPRGALRARIAPTEKEQDLRPHMAPGEVDDGNAFSMGGAAGHAGLFSTAGDLAVFSQMLLNGGTYAHHRLLPGPLITQFTARQPIGDSARTLGWDVPTEPSSTGRYFGPRSFGHNGFTGTSLWIDPEKRLFVILLTNRVYPSAANDKIRQVRPALHDAILQALRLAPAAAEPTASR